MIWNIAAKEVCRVEQAFSRWEFYLEFAEATWVTACCGALGLLTSNGCPGPHPAIKNMIAVSEISSAIVIFIFFLSMIPWVLLFANDSRFGRVLVRSWFFPVEFLLPLALA